MITALLVIYAGLVIGLIAAEFKGAYQAQTILKPLAALGFIIIALMSGAMGSAYGLWILAALIFCAVGDVALLARDKQAHFLLGMAAFAAGHALYIVAFTKLTLVTDPLWTYAVIAGFVGAVFYLWLWRYLDGDMKAPVGVYSLIILGMVVTAALAVRTPSGVAVIVPAAMFAVSDMFVARDRFVKAEPKNALAISPLYFGAQALFALSVQM